MFDFHEKRKIKAWVYSWPMIVVLLIPIGFLSVSVYERYQKERDTKEKRDEQSVKLEALEERASALEAKVEYAKSTEGIEEEIRSRYDVAKEGEQIVIIIDGEEGSNTANVNASRTEPKRKSFFKWLKFW